MLSIGVLFDFFINLTKVLSGQTKHWRKKLDNKNHYQAMLNDTENVYFYRVKSRDAASDLFIMLPLMSYW
jgi:hypothetical protein